jgi:hypothetical protein
MRQLIGNTAEWAANNIVLGNGELGVERISASEYKMKCGDGATRWSSLPYISETSISSTVQAALNGKLNISGGTMTGALFLAKDATQAKEPVTLTQLNNEKTRVDNDLKNKLDISGGTLTGPLVLAKDATQSKEPVTLDQMNTEITNRLSSISSALDFVGALDLTSAYAAPVPAPANGNLYATSSAGPVDPTWSAYIAGGAPATVNIGDHLVWSTADNKFHFFAASASGGAYVAISGTNAMAGAITWSGADGSRTGTTMLNGKGASMTGWAIDGGTY